MLFLNIHKAHRYIVGAHYVKISDAITPEEIQILNNDGVDETEDLHFTDDEAIALGINTDDLVFNKDIYIFTENNELKLRPYIDPQFFFYNSDQIGEKIVSINENTIFEEDEPTYNVPVGTKVLCKVIIHNPDNLEVVKRIESIWIKDRLNLVDLPGNEIIFNHEKNCIYFAFSSDRTGVANLKFKDDKFITQQTNTVFSFRFISEPIESLDI